MSNGEKKRILWIDSLKGICIVLVIIGHTITGITRNIIFSFHMPLFFLLSGYTSRPVNNKIKDKLRKNFQRLFLPAYAVWLIRLIISGFINNHFDSLDYILSSAFYASGTRIIIDGKTIPAFGMMWFLIVLFSVRTIFDLLVWKINNKAAVYLIILSICIAGLLLDRRFPFSFDVTMEALFFYSQGYFLKDKNYSAKTQKGLIICSGLLWFTIFAFLQISNKHFEMATRSYPYGPVSLVMASSACICITMLANNIKQLNRYSILSKLGSNTLTLFIIHAFDVLWYDAIQRISGEIIVTAILRITIDLILLGVIDCMKKKIIRIKTNKAQIGI